MAGQTRNGELPEFPVVGPFGGIQSELPSELIQSVGQADALNIMFLNGAARVRPRFNAVLPPSPPIVRIADLQGTIAEQAWTPSGSPYNYGTGTSDGLPGFYSGGVFTSDTPRGSVEPWTAATDFFDSNGNRHQVVTTKTQVYEYVNGNLARLTGGLSTGVPNFTVVGQKLCFSQGVDPIQSWDGIASTYNQIAGAPAAKYLFEFENHLVALNTLESGSHAYQRVHWSGADDPTDWTSFNSGQTDLFNDMGPINGGLKLFSYGYIFQQKGIVQMQATGNGLQPFYFIQLSSKAKGLTVPRSLASDGTNAYYVGLDDVYAFDGTTSNPIGHMPVGNRVSLGARTRIFADIKLAEPSTIFGYVSTSINGNPYNSYWLVIPNVAIWVFSIEEQNWTRWTVSGTATCIADFILQTNIRICDLVGSIEQQQWAPATLTNDNPFPAVMLGLADGTAFLFDFTGWSEEAWSFTTGELDYSDPRHESTTKKLRLSYKDNGACVVNVLFSNEDGETSVNAPTASNGFTLSGTNSGKARKIVLPVNLSGSYVTMKLSGDAGTPLELSGYAPIYSQDGEVRNAL